jgi:subtilisin family serine protease
MATPHVSGIAALVLEKYPNLNQYQMQTILKNAATKIPLACDGAWVYDPFYATDSGIWPWHFEWTGYRLGIRLANNRQRPSAAYVFTIGRFKVKTVPLPV